MQISDFHYDLPDELIAQYPLAERDASRMLIVDRAAQSWRDTRFADLAENLTDRDVLVLNNTRVFPARLRGRRAGSGGAIELLLLREVEGDTWEALTRPARRLQVGAEIAFEDADLHAKIVGESDHGIRLIKFSSAESLETILDRIGEPPLPPYIKRSARDAPEDKARYQTIYANHRGSIAAPTAGLHFTRKVLQSLDERGIPQRSDQRSLAHISLTNQQNLSLVLRNGIFEAAEVSGKGIRTSFHQLRERLIKRITFQSNC